MADGNFINQLVPEDISLAIECVKNVFMDALTSGRHERGDWRKFDIAEQCSKAQRHLDLTSFFDGRVTFPNSSEDDLANAACRILLALQLRQESCK